MPRGSSRPDSRPTSASTRPNTRSAVAESFLAPATADRLKLELRGSIKRGDSEIFERVFGKPSTSDVQLYKALRPPGEWAEEADFAENIKYLVKQGVLPPNHRLRSCGDTMLRGSPVGRKPDVVLLLPEGSRVAGPPMTGSAPSAADLWDAGVPQDREEGHLAAAFELKVQFEKDGRTYKVVDRSTIERQPLDLMLLLLRQPGRTHALTFSITNDLFRLFYGSSSGIIISKSINVTKEQSTFIHFLVALSSLPLDQLGLPFNAPYGFPRVATIPDSYTQVFPSPSPSSLPTSRTFTLLRTLQARTRIIGRSTTAYELTVTDPATAGTVQVVLKSTFNDVAPHAFLVTSGFLHRDISIGNVMVYQDANNDLRGILIDYDLAVPLQATPHAPTARHRTGTLPFMARDLLVIGAEELPLHTAAHDIESLFYVMCWVIIHDFNPLESLKGVAADIYDMWNSGGYKARTAKDAFRGSGDRLFLQWVAWQAVRPYHALFNSFFSNFQKAIFDYTGRFSHDALLRAIA
ncbi:hypothetical protein RQP46_003131 [Phenoliferia psychrophenolica]